MSTVGVILGANRSLTTLFSAVMAFHPQVTILNHAFVRIFANPAHDFVVDPAERTLESFVETARDLALGGERGAVGGHILHSHAFGDKALRDAYLDCFGWGEKPETGCLLWKDATRVTSHIVNHKIDPAAVARRLPALRFMMIVRNPVDIAISSVNKGYSAALVGEDRKDSLEDVFVHVVKLFAWFSEAAGANHSQFRFLYQDEMLDRGKLVELCGFLDIPAAAKWLDDVARLIHLRPSYPISEAHKQHFRSLAQSLIPDRLIARRVAEQII